jgi:hypothetical protein
MCGQTICLLREVAGEKRGNYFPFKKMLWVNWFYSRKEMHNLVRFLAWHRDCLIKKKEDGQLFPIDSK